MKIFGNEKMMHKDLDNKGETKRDIMARDEHTTWGNNCNRTQVGSSSVGTTCVLTLEAPNAQGTKLGELNKNGMTADVIHIRDGEDIREKIIQHLKEAEKSHPSFQGHALSVTILTAVGTVRNFTLHACGSDKYYEGEYTLTSLKGEFFIQKDGKVEQLNKLKILLSGPQYVIFGGDVLGSLISASATQVVVGYIFMA